MQRAATSALVLLVTLLIAAGSAPVAAHPPAIVNAPAEHAIAEEIVDFRRRLAAAIKAKDAGALKTMFAEHFQHVDQSGTVIAREAYIKALVAGDPLIETIEPKSIGIRAHAGGWAVVVSGTSPFEQNGKTYAQRWTAFYARTEQSWEVTASHATRSDAIKP